MNTSPLTRRLAATLVALLALAPLLASASIASPAPVSPVGKTAPAACIVLLGGTQARRHCVESGDMAIVKQPAAALGAPVIWDRIIVDPTTRGTLKQVVA
ncbi:hypothetical protein [Cupriavidus agavae]|uniref:Uncharacterized protein n=1 Tax=Cupriavidus agavae TaxID=1001822 RepID=A0A4Q7RE21_9BURK|nr:hypothetical protein [Cupriavidus agavae]RZT31416.1 hypothetical protein EV147_4597 [Cupriavidus agavae]